MQHLQGLVTIAFGLFCLYVAYKGKQFWPAQADRTLFVKICASSVMRVFYFLLGLISIFEGVRLVLGFELA